MIIKAITNNKLSILSCGLGIFTFWKDAEGYIKQPVTEHIIPLMGSILIIVILLLYKKYSRKAVKYTIHSNYPDPLVTEENENVEDSAFNELDRPTGRDASNEKPIVYEPRLPKEEVIVSPSPVTGKNRVLYSILLFITIISATFTTLTFFDFYTSKVFYLKFTNEIDLGNAIAEREGLRGIFKENNLSPNLRILPKSGNYVVCEGFLSKKKAEKSLLLYKKTLKGKYPIIHISKPARLPLKTKLKYFSLYNLFDSK